VLRDTWGVPHIYAQTLEDLFLAQGFVVAQDRLWQLELWRRTGEGRLAEILGPSAVERDKFARLMRYRGDMELEWRSYSPDARLIVECFVRGVNAFIDLSRDRPPLEFQLLDIAPEHWSPQVCLTRMAGYLMTRVVSHQVLRAQLVEAIGIEMTSELLETDPRQELIIPEGLDLRGIEARVFATADLASQPISFDCGEGSNNWVVSGSRTSTGKPILANDPHRLLALPSLRFITHLVGPGWNVIGAGEPGLPGVAAGHNDHIAFGFTVMGIDQQDLYVEETHPDDPTLYLYKDKWEHMTVVKEQINVKGQEPIQAELCFSVHGPVIYRDPEHHRAYSLRWVGSEPGAAGYLASLSYNRARNWQEFQTALERFKLPSENMVYADTSGNIGWQAAGLAPIRRGSCGLLPVPGADGKHEWDGFRPFSDLPRLYNPDDHFIATANHNVLPPGYPHLLGFDWQAPFRFNRIKEVLQGGNRFTVKDFERLQHDEVSTLAREIVPLLKNVEGDSDRLTQAIALLLGWDLVLSKDSAAAAVYEVWASKLNVALFASLVPAEVWPAIRDRLYLTKLSAALNNPSEKFLGKDPEKHRNELLLTCLVQALDYLQAYLGADMDKWQWGNIHLAEFKHPLAMDESTRSLFNAEPISRGGDVGTVNATPGDGFRQVKGASFRQIIDLSDWDKSVAINAPGQSGQPGSPHYADLLPLWADGKYFPLLFSRRAIESNTRHRLLLVN
jgi:penicillin amidase